MKVAEVQFQRKRYDDGVNELRRVWEEFSGSSFAPKAMFRAGVLLGGLPDRQAQARKTLEELALNYPTNALSPRAFELLKKLPGSDLPNEVYRGTSVSRPAAEESAASGRSSTGEAARESRRTFYESAAEALAQQGRQDEALDVIADDLQGQVTGEKLRELLSLPRRVRIRNSRQRPRASCLGRRHTRGFDGARSHAEVPRGERGGGGRPLRANSSRKPLIQRSPGWRRSRKRSRRSGRKTPRKR